MLFQHPKIFQQQGARLFDRLAERRFLAPANPYFDLGWQVSRNGLHFFRSCFGILRADHTQHTDLGPFGLALPRLIELGEREIRYPQEAENGDRESEDQAAVL